MYGRGGYGYGGMMDGLGWHGAGLLMMVFGLLVLVGIVLLIMWAMRASGGGHHHTHGAPPPVQPGGHDEAVAIARRRLANGEITKEQYDDIMRSLNG